MWGLTLLYFCYLFTNGYSNPKIGMRVDPLVQTKVGLIRGQHAPDGNYAMFLGIPYAQIDMENPFGDHKPQPPFQDVFEAFDDTAICPQNSGKIEGTLDCLQLNVYVPSSPASSRNRLPVMVWIHGGAFQRRSKNKYEFGPKYLISHEVIVVAVNYRVGLYGFMCLDIPEVPGNQGLKDQQAALKWVKENIASFGGDDTNIAIFGESAGAASVDLQFRYNKDDTFNKVIMQSGSASGSWAIQDPDYSLAVTIAEKLGFKAENSSDAINYLSSLDPHLVIEANSKVGMDCWPCAEKQFDGVKRFIHDYAMNIDIPKAKTTSILFGVNNGEWLLRYDGQDAAFFDTLDIFEKNLKEAFRLTDEEERIMEDVIKRFYLGGDAVSKEKLLEIADFDSDFNFIHPAKMSIADYIKNDAPTIYTYLFTYVGERSKSVADFNSTTGKAFHADDLGYLFDSPSYNQGSEEDILMLNRMTTMWTNFVKYGNPTPTITELLPVQWPKVTDNISYYLELGSELKVGNTMFHDRMAFWDLIYMINHTKRKGYSGYSDGSPIVQTNVGTIRGLQATNGNYAMYLGIPYAKIDKDNPFGPHLTQPPFNETFDAIDDSNVCPQTDEFSGEQIGNLDCLVLNVYVPNSANASNPLPVMVWIHGGAFVKGSGNRILYGPKYLVRHEIILVTLNYRLGPYGFMCLDIPEVPGNQGLKDQEAALRWVKNNIAAFGGNDSTITVFGESAGSVSVDLQFRFGDPDLFDKIIMQSGSASGNWAIQKPRLDYAIQLARFLKYETNDTKDAVRFLSQANPHDVTLATISVGGDGSLWPCVEKPFANLKRFITDYTLNLYIPRAANKPFLLGVNSDEWMLRYISADEDYFKTLNIFQNDLLEGFDFIPSYLEEMEELVKQFYLGDKEVAKNQTQLISNFDTDFTFIHPAARSIEEYLKNGASNIYRYIFRHSGKRNYMQHLMNVTYDGAFHADDLGYLFENQKLNEPNSEDQIIIDRLTTMWTNFAKYGNPTPEVTELLPVKWLPVTPEKSYYLDIGKELKVGTRPLNERMAFWDLFFRLNEKLRVGYKDPFPRTST